MAVTEWGGGGGSAVSSQRPKHSVLWVLMVIDEPAFGSLCRHVLAHGHTQTSETLFHFCGGRSRALHPLSKSRHVPCVSQPESCSFVHLSNATLPCSTL